MAWISLSITCPRKSLDGLKELLETFSPVSISFSSASNESMFDQGSGDVQYWRMTMVTALLGPHIDIEIIMACIRNRIGMENLLEHRVDVIHDKDWETSVQGVFNPIIIEGLLCICPSWFTPPSKIPHIIRLDPGLAFGTGSHETTSLCLKWLASTAVTGKQIIDYGCGSGILGIAALKLGANQVIAVDIDPQATRVTAENALNNGLKSKMTVCSTLQSTSYSADILLANILLEPLVKMVKKFHTLLKPRGQIVVSGILAHQVESVVDSYDSFFNMSQPVFQKEWAMLVGVKKGN